MPAHTHTHTHTRTHIFDLPCLSDFLFEGAAIVAAVYKQYSKDRRRKKSIEVLKFILPL